MEFSKKLVVATLAATMICGVVIIYGSLYEHDMTALQLFASDLLKADGVVGALYLWKAKNENRAKYAQKFVKQFANTYGIDAAIRIAEVVLKD